MEDRGRLERYYRALETKSLDRLVGCSYYPMWLHGRKDRWVYCNPSIARHPDGGFVSLVRYSSWPRVTVVYPVHSDLVLARLDDDYNVVSMKPLAEPKRQVDTSFKQTYGPEDARLFRLKGRWYATATFFDVPECRVDSNVFARMGLLEFDEDFNWTDLTVLPCPFKQHEKNWMNIEGEMAWLYSAHDTRVARYNFETRLLGYYYPQPTPEIMQHARGSSQLIDIGKNRLLGVVHESVQEVPTRSYIGSYRAYSHRFVLYSREPFELKAVSELFHFFAPGHVEFAAGLAAADARLVVSFGHHDSWAWLAAMKLDNVLNVLNPV
jgi:predicted GH43/DUF377 family glycosyl hydrolase